ncbi:unnamed protein product [Gongylonema pulchrum]|uniref:Reverse transcriptase n=1 Tax=Gongylonema pulchrum TaxID=637853 RepID=A0A183ECV9_9BILA|nr:unnamed protein product [Gongylonema pulchrum]
MPSDFASELGDDDWQDTDDWALYSSGKFEGDLNIDMDIIILPNVSEDQVTTRSERRHE